MGLISVGASLGIAKPSAPSDVASSASRTRSLPSVRRPRSCSSQAPATSQSKRAKSSHSQRQNHANTSKASTAAQRHKRFPNNSSSSCGASGPGASALAGSAGSGGVGLVMQILTVPVTCPPQVLAKEVIGVRGSRINTVCRQSGCSISYRDNASVPVSASHAHSLTFAVSGDTMKRVVHGMRMMQSHVETMDTQMHRQHQQRDQRREQRAKQPAKQPQKTPSTPERTARQVQWNGVVQQQQQQQQQPVPDALEEEEEPQEIPVPTHDVSPRPKRQKTRDNPPIPPPAPPPTAPAPAPSSPSRTNEDQPTRSPNQRHRRTCRSELFRAGLFAPIDSLVLQTWRQEQRAQRRETKRLERHLRRRLVQQQRRLLDTVLRKQGTLLASTELSDERKRYQLQLLTQVLQQQQFQLNQQLNHVARQALSLTRQRRGNGVLGRKGCIKRFDFVAADAASSALSSSSSSSWSSSYKQKSDPLVRRVKQWTERLQYPEPKLHGDHALDETEKEEKEKKKKKKKQQEDQDLNCVPSLEHVHDLAWVPRQLLTFVAGQRQYFYLEPFEVMQLPPHGSGNKSYCFPLCRSDRKQLIHYMHTKVTPLQQLVHWTKGWGENLTQHTLNMKWPKMLTQLNVVSEVVVVLHFMGLDINHQLHRKRTIQSTPPSANSSRLHPSPFGPAKTAQTRRTIGHVDLMFESEWHARTQTTQRMNANDQRSKMPLGVSKGIGSKSLLKQMLGPLRQFGLHENPFDLSRDDDAIACGFDLTLPLTLEKETSACCPELFVHVLEWQHEQDIPKHILEEAIGMRVFDKQIVKGSQGLRSVFMMHLWARLRTCMMEYECEYMHLLRLLEIWTEVHERQGHDDEDDDDDDDHDNNKHSSEHDDGGDGTLGAVDLDGNGERDLLQSINALKTLTAQLVAIQIEVLLVKWAWTFLENRSKWAGLLWRAKERHATQHDGLTCTRFTCLQDALVVWHQVRVKYHALDFEDEDQEEEAAAAAVAGAKEVHEPSMNVAEETDKVSNHTFEEAMTMTMGQKPSSATDSMMQWPWSDDTQNTAKAQMQSSLLQTTHRLKLALSASSETFSDIAMARLQRLRHQVEQEVVKLTTVQQYAAKARKNHERTDENAREQEQQQKPMEQKEPASATQPPRPAKLQANEQDKDEQQAVDTQAPPQRATPPVAPKIDPIVEKPHQPTHAPAVVAAHATIAGDSQPILQPKPMARPQQPPASDFSVAQLLASPVREPVPPSNPRVVPATSMSTTSAHLSALMPLNPPVSSTTSTPVSVPLDTSPMAPPMAPTTVSGPPAAVAPTTPQSTAPSPIIVDSVPPTVVATQVQASTAPPVNTVPVTSTSKVALGSDSSCAPPIPPKPDPVPATTQPPAPASTTTQPPGSSQTPATVQVSAPDFSTPTPPLTASTPAPSRAAPAPTTIPIPLPARAVPTRGAGASIRRPEPQPTPVRARFVAVPASSSPAPATSTPPVFVNPVKGVADPLRKGCIGCRDLRRRCCVCERCCMHCTCPLCSCRDCQLARRSRHGGNPSNPSADPMHTQPPLGTAPTPRSGTTVQGDGFVMHHAWNRQISPEEQQRQRELLEQEQMFRAARARMKVQMRRSLVPGTSEVHGGTRVLCLANASLWQPERIFHAWSVKNALAVLGLLSCGDNHPNASLRLSEQLIKSQYRKLALKLHPDKTQRHQEEENKAAEAFVIVNHAYQAALDDLAKQTHPE